MSEKFRMKTDVTVVRWPKPDTNGDGDVVDKDDNGKEIKRYRPPAGFKNFPTRNEQGVMTADNYVAVNDREEAKRDPSGAPILLSEGGVGVTYPDGTYEHLVDEAAQTAFFASHELVGKPDVQAPLPVAQ